MKTRATRVYLTCVVQSFDGFEQKLWVMWDKNPADGPKLGSVVTTWTEEGFDDLRDYVSELPPFDPNVIYSMVLKATSITTEVRATGDTKVAKRRRGRPKKSVGATNRDRSTNTPSGGNSEDDAPNGAN